MINGVIGLRQAEGALPEDVEAGRVGRADRGKLPCNTRL
jgi:hypothetical protein